MNIFKNQKVDYRPLEQRTFRYKNPHMEFFCPLCATKRAVTTSPHLNLKNFLQVSLITMALTAVFFPLMQWKGAFSFFLVWAFFEAALRLNFRKEVPCPHCGFDASWYKKDVNVARRKVDEFWGDHKKSVAQDIPEDDGFGARSVEPEPEFEEQAFS